MHKTSEERNKNKQEETRARKKNVGRQGFIIDTNLRLVRENSRKHLNTRQEQNDMQQEQQQQKKNKTQTKPRRQIVLQDDKDITRMTIETRRETRKQIGNTRNNTTVQETRTMITDTGHVEIHVWKS